MDWLGGKQDACGPLCPPCSDSSSAALGSVSIRLSDRSSEWYVLARLPTGSNQGSAWELYALLRVRMVMKD